MAHDDSQGTSGPTKLVIRNIGLLLSGAMENPILDADTIVAQDGKITAIGRAKDVDTEGATTIVGLLQRLNALDASIDRQTAIDTLAAVSDIRLALVLRESYGWSLDHIEQWIATTSQALLLARS